MHHYYFLPELILRTPKNPFTAEITIDFVMEQMQDEAFQEAIYVASPSPSLIDFLNGEITSEKHQKNIIQSCTKYILRSRTRATPFGLFSSIGLVYWGKKNKIEIKMRLKEKPD